MTDRRGFLRLIGRCGALAGLGLLGAFLVAPTDGRRHLIGCGQGSQCRGCGRLPDCAEPEADRQRSIDLQGSRGVNG
ncbi:MAG: hypothetical protein GY906_40395 [bacterium]|nr:hypothetical protein [bacterium]